MASTKNHVKVGAAIGISFSAISNYIKQQKLKQLNPDYKFD